MSFDPMGYPQFDDCTEIADGQKDAIIAAQKIHGEGQSAEIERLRTEQIKMFKAYDALEQKSVGQKAEIEQLKAELDLSQNAVCDQIAYAHKLIIELADAIPIQFMTPELYRIVKRAREVTR